MSSINFTLGLDRTQWKSDIEAARRDILGLTNTAKSETSKMDSSFKNLSLGIAGYFSVNAVQGFVRELINVRGEFQKTEIAFTTMLGNADQAKSLMADMVELAAKTPFSLQDVSSGAKQLLAFQVPANEVVDTLTRLGNIAAGLSVPLSRINLVYGQVKAKGKLMGDDLRQFTEAGIPMVAELAKKFGTTTSAITEMVSAGKIGFKDVQDVLFSMTNEGGMFYNLMEKQSKSLSGQIANLGDSWDQMLNKIGEANEGILSDGIQGLTYLVQHYEDVIQVVGTLVATYGAYRAALIAANALNKASILIESTQAAIRFAQGISGMTKAQLLFNSAARTNPYVLLATGIAAVVGAFVYYKTGAEDAADATNQLNDSLETAYKESGKEVSKLSELYKKASDLKTSTDERKKAIKELQTLYPSYFGNLDSEAFKTGKAKDAYYELRDAIVASAKARAAQAELERRSGEYIKNREKLVKKRNNFINDMKNSTDREIDRGDGGVIIVDEEDLKFNNRQKAIDTQYKIFALDKKFENDNKDLLDFKEVNEKKAAKLEKDKQKRIENSVNSNSGTKAVKDKNAEKEKEEQKKSFEDELKELERQWNIRYKLEEKYGLKIAKAQFPSLKGDSYFSDIESRFKAIDKKLNSGTKLTDEELNKWQSLKEILENLSGIKDPFTNFKENLDKELSSVSTSFEKIEILKNKSKNLTPKQKDNGYLVEVNNRIEAEFQSQESAYQEFLKTTQSFEEKRTEIAKKYAAQRQKIYQDSNLSETQKQNALISSDKLENSDISEAFANSVLNDPIFTQNFEKIGEFAFAQFDKIKAALIKKLEEARNLGLDENSDVVQRIIEQLNRLDEVANRNPFSELINDWKNFIDSLKNGESDLQGIASKVAAGASMVNKSISVGLGIAQDLGLQFDDSTQEVINDVQTTVAGVGDLAAGIASKNPMQIIKGIAGVVKGLAGLFNGDRKKDRRIKEWAKEVEGLKEKYEELQNQVKKALGEDVYADQQKIVANLRQQQALLQKMMNEEKKKKKSDSNKVNDYKNQINAIDQQIEEMYDNITKSILQTDAKELASQLADALIEAYGKGEDAASAYGKVADDVMKNAVKNALKLQLLEKPMQDIIKQMLKNMGFDEQGNGSFDGLTKEERDSLKAMMASASQNYMDALGAYEDLFGESAANAQGLKGDIKGITEKTAGALEGQINAIRIYQVESLNVSKRNQQIFLDALKYQAEIAYNTRELKAIRIGIDDLNIKIRKGLAL